MFDIPTLKSEYLVLFHKTQFCGGWFLEFSFLQVRKCVVCYVASARVLEVVWLSHQILRFCYEVMFWKLGEYIRWISGRAKMKDHEKQKQWDSDVWDRERDIDKFKVSTLRFSSQLQNWIIDKTMDNARTSPQLSASANWECGSFPTPCG